MRKFKFRKITALVLVFSMMIGMSGSVFAEGEENSNFTVTFSTTEITGKESLIDLAICQMNTEENSLNREKSNKTPGQLTAVQFLEERKYQNGVTERDYSSTVLALSQDEAIERGVIGTLPESSVKIDDFIPEFSVMTTFYYTIRGDFDDIILASYTYRVDKLITKITKNGSSDIVVTSANHMYRASLSSGAEKWQNINYNNAVTGGTQAFTLMSSHSGFYESNNDFLTAVTYGVGAQSVVEFSNGYNTILQFAAYY